MISPDDDGRPRGNGDGPSKNSSAENRSTLEHESTAERLHRIRRAQGLKVRDVAAVAGLSAFRVRQLERAQGARPRRAEERALATALSISIDTLAGEGDRGVA